MLWAAKQVVAFKGARVVLGLGPFKTACYKDLIRLLRDVGHVWRLAMATPLGQTTLIPAGYVTCRLSYKSVCELLHSEPIFIKFGLLNMILKLQVGYNQKRRQLAVAFSQSRPSFPLMHTSCCIRTHLMFETTTASCFLLCAARTVDPFVLWACILKAFYLHSTG